MQIIKFPKTVFYEDRRVSAGTYDTEAEALKGLPQNFIEAHSELFKPDYGAAEETTAKPGVKRATARKGS